jgi:hypothetical protein
MLEPWAEKIMYYMAHATIIVLAVILAVLIIMLISALILGCVKLIKSIWREKNDR